MSRPKRQPVPFAKSFEKAGKKYGFNRDKVRELHDTFCVFDKNGDGMITADELGTVLFKLGQRPSANVLNGLMRSVDVDRSGSIDFEEFLEIFTRKLSIDPEKELHEVFEVFDNDKDGGICPDELYTVLQKLGESITRDEAEAMIKEADNDMDGKVDYRGNYSPVTYNVYRNFIK
ncbi:Calmodulin [Mizuhopecten yessoensis]|uniref:Calmodulin n=1 Tax=Mizuhopecten yessoensis TaxID=6573 RepID=A0A210PF14_MIZYE|nr:Calmodulin [Mizuhopecten yessoensis]